jgi:curved DNA-binding protein CbpA
LAKELHPDIAKGDGSKFRKLNEAYASLIDSYKRAEYDRYGSQDQRSSNSYSQAKAENTQAKSGGFYEDSEYLRKEREVQEREAEISRQAQERIKKERAKAQQEAKEREVEAKKTEALSKKLDRDKRLLSVIKNPELLSNPVELARQYLELISPGSKFNEEFALKDAKNKTTEELQSRLDKAIIQEQRTQTNIPIARQYLELISPGSKFNEEFALKDAKNKTTEELQKILDREIQKQSEKKQ